MEYTNISMIGNDKVRYVLKKQGQNPLFVLGVNPSTADDVKSDHTITRVCGFAQRLGFDSFVMINVYPLRATDIMNLPTDADIDIHAANLNIICDEIAAVEHPTILIAHGNSISKKKYLRSCLNDLLRKLAEFKNAEFIQLGELTAQGNPRHPLMARADVEIKEYRFK